MAQTITELVESLPKPETLEEQYMYALVCSLAGVTPQCGISANAFKRKEKYWYALWQVLAAKFEDTAEEEGDEP